MANNVASDETARDEPSHLELHCFQKYLYWSAGMKELIATKEVYITGLTKILGNSADSDQTPLNV